MYLVSISFVVYVVYVALLVTEGFHLLVAIDNGHCSLHLAQGFQSYCMSLLSPCFYFHDLLGTVNSPHSYLALVGNDEAGHLDRSYRNRPSEN